ncbi:MAG: MoaD/ThiS family protein [Congregibacter sp.]|nr:MoaD/ThiS family protein [Congregibacter sp.]
MNITSNKEHPGLKVKFFARLRELCGSDGVELSDADCPADVAGLRATLQRQVNADLAEALAAPNVLCAVNQKVVDDACPITCTDEIAFFPPMTGG